MSQPDRPLVSLLLACYRQERFIAEAVQAALAQAYSPLEIIISDDASPDATFALAQQAVQGYAGPHRVMLRRNPRNLGISAHFSLLAELAQGELLVVAAGDDVSEPQRCERLVAHWLGCNRRPDLIASDLVDIDIAGRVQQRLAHTRLDDWTLGRWLQQRPWLVGASHAWSKRLFAAFGPMRAGAHAEDQIMLLRALLLGGATTVPEPLVRWRRGGLSAKRRAPDLATLRLQMAQGNRASLAAIEQHLADAQQAGRGEEIAAALAAPLARARFTAAMLEPSPRGSTWRRFLQATGVPLDYRLRLLGYTTLPWLIDPLLRTKERLRIARHGDAAGRPLQD
jgi:hypothetical protein